MNNEYLAHHGIKGQKWGVRRFRNEDGTLTAAGKKRYGSDQVDPRRKVLNKRGIDSEALWKQSVKGGKDKPNRSPAEVITGETQKTVGNVRKGIFATRNLRNSKHLNDLGKVSDEELRKRVARLELEQRYNNLSANNISRGEYVVNNTLDLTESVAGIAASAATVYAILKMVEKK